MKPVIIIAIEFVLLISTVPTAFAAGAFFDKNEYTRDNNAMVIVRD